jgi:Ca2+-binding RTX toxin-like protein
VEYVSQRECSPEKAQLEDRKGVRHMMRRLILLVISGALMTALAATAAFAQRSPESPGPDETFMGTEESEVLFGTNANDLIEGLGGDDYLNGLWGHDVIYGAAEGKPSAGDDLLVGEADSDRLEGSEGNDFLIAAYGYWQVAPDVPASPDLLRGGEGHDIIDAADRAGAPDTVECGEGSDLVYAGVEDFVADDCEFVYRYEGF